MKLRMQCHDTNKSEDISILFQQKAEKHSNIFLSIQRLTSFCMKHCNILKRYYMLFAFILYFFQSLCSQAYQNTTHINFKRHSSIDVYTSIRYHFWSISRKANKLVDRVEPLRKPHPERLRSVNATVPICKYYLSPIILLVFL